MRQYVVSRDLGVAERGSAAIEPDNLPFELASYYTIKTWELAATAI